MADETRNDVAARGQNDTFKLPALLAELKENLAAGKDYKEARIFNTVPVVAGWTAAKEAAAREDIVFRITSFDARNKENEPEPGSFNAQLLTDLEREFKGNGLETITRVNTETDELHYMRAVKISQDCHEPAMRARALLLSPRKYALWPSAVPRPHAKQPT